MVTNHLHGPQRRLEAVGPVAAVGTGTDGTWTLWVGQGAARGARGGRGRSGAPDGAQRKAAVGSLEGASEVTRLSALVPRPVPTSGDHQEE